MQNRSNVLTRINGLCSTHSLESTCIYSVIKYTQSRGPKRMIGSTSKLSIHNCIIIIMLCNVCWPWSTALHNTTKELGTIATMIAQAHVQLPFGSKQYSYCQQIGCLQKISCMQVRNSLCNVNYCNTYLGRFKRWSIMSSQIHI